MILYLLNESRNISNTKLSGNNTVHIKMVLCCTMYTCE